MKLGVNKVVIALATRGRAKVLRQTVEATVFQIGRHNTELVVCLDDDDHASIAAISEISSAHVVPDIRSREDSLGGKYNRVIGRGDIYVVMVDYAPILTQGFDNLIVKAAQVFEDGIVFLYGPLANLSFPSMQAITHRTAEIMGHIYPEDYAFWFVDHHMHEIALMTGRIAHVPIKVDFVTARHGFTTECRDVRFWTVFFDAMAVERQRIASNLIHEMDIPDWLKRGSKLRFEGVQQWTTMYHHSVRAQVQTTEYFRKDPRPPDERYHRIKARAEDKLNASYLGKEAAE